jgi:2Fe-2S ferredoxin
VKFTRGIDAAPKGRTNVPKVVFLAQDGTEKEIDAVENETVMATAVKNGVRGIVGECGGNCTCATCHVYVHGDYLDLVGAPGDFEADMLDLATSDRQANSRLSCQIRVRAELDGLIVTLPLVQP